MLDLSPALNDPLMRDMFPRSHSSAFTYKKTLTVLWLLIGLSFNILLHSGASTNSSDGHYSDLVMAALPSLRLWRRPAVPHAPGVLTAPMQKIKLPHDGTHKRQIIHIVRGGPKEVQGDEQVEAPESVGLADKASSKLRSVKVCVFGSGRFGTALATVIARNGYSVTLHTRRPEAAESINSMNVNPLMPEYKLPRSLNSTTSAADALKGASFIVHTIPVQSTEEFLSSLKDLIPTDVPIVSCSKGLHTDTLETMADLVPRVLGRKQPMSFLSGPTFAQELMSFYPSGVVLASQDAQLAERCAALFNCAAIRVYTSSDVVGVEIGGALKNVYALAAGAIEGLGYGANSVTFLVTRACAEMNVLAVAMGAKSHTMAGLAGVGDLMLTCMGGLSRNKAVGMRVAKGESLESVLEARGQSLAGVAEGVATTPAAVKLAKRLNVEVPLINAVATVLEGKGSIPQVVRLLMTEQEYKSDFAAAASVHERKQRRRAPDDR
eukprot:gnl/MRDRNA2_/MRDRNA2_27135_c0_seq1.p1 gnl/MRDRNA2_/MRDRNA2_27135_c0~~gnl/MRDRNA2_/MRDRNA2_27135_c0_seq1.p1  ORF type:complete len:493 (+),score=67.09 gnl/MRDRNA2_/MRDRNA2_27135_c0_seq1:60-1538(+)